ncbi:HEAT repeat domain-containing protein [Dictyobacter arantiisoli]|uniref:HEAT repeat domain-containing protein n=1 Tax=Dictyobacter arantiisoli TaxID=2014874 RepID=A0A5A5TGI9_9CHLR|nr:HEAT repeat domain-containing protein [Dictyobacter arantiisoli]GCF10700.1 hypothetical protein KDI_42640 [Dictyobacter arantiisoli]
MNNMFDQQFVFKNNSLEQHQHQQRRQPEGQRAIPASKSPLSFWAATAFGSGSDLAATSMKTCCHIQPLNVQPISASSDALIETLLEDTLEKRLETLRLISYRALDVTADIQQVLTLLLDDPEIDIRDAAATALGEVGGHAQLDALRRALDDPEWQVRTSAIQALGTLRDNAALEYLLEMLQDGDESVREAALWSLARFEQHAPLLKLTELLNDPNELVRNAAVEVLGTLRPYHPPLALLLLFKGAQKDESELVRAAALKILLTYEQPIAEPCFLQAMEDESELVRLTVLQTQAHVQKLIAIEPVILALKDASQSVSAEASLLLSLFVQDVFHDTEKEFLLLALKNPHQEIRALAIWALGERIEQDTLDPLLQALQDPDETVRMIADWAILQLEASDDSPDKERNHQHIGLMDTFVYQQVAERFALPPVRRDGGYVFATLLDILADKKGFVSVKLYQEEEEILLLLFNYQLADHSIYQALYDIYEVSFELIPSKLATNGKDQVIRMLTNYLRQEHIERPWSEIFMLFLERTLPEQYTGPRRRPISKIAICALGYQQVRENDVSIQQCIDNYFDCYSLDQHLRNSLCEVYEHAPEFDAIHNIWYDNHTFAATTQQADSHIMPKRRKSDRRARPQLLPLR